MLLHWSSTILRRVVTEIEEIRGGLWDDKIKSKITGVPIEAPVKDASEPPHSPTVNNLPTHPLILC